MLPIRDVPDGYLRRSHVSKRQPKGFEEAVLWNWATGPTLSVNKGSQIRAFWSSVARVRALEWQRPLQMMAPTQKHLVEDTHSSSKGIIAPTTCMLSSEAACRMPNSTGFLSIVACICPIIDPESGNPCHHLSQA